jgi:uroporphyrinogen-III synthase
MKLLVTRPFSAASELAAKLMANGHSVLCSPVLKIQFRENAAIEITGVQAFIVTSMNGAEGLANATKRRDLPLYCVGEKTARIAAEYGFQNIKPADGDVISLHQLIKHDVDAAKGVLLHAGGARLAGDLKGALEADGFQYRREILYDAPEAKTLALDAENALRHNEIDGVLLFSPHTAKVFCKLVDEAGLKTQIQSLTAWCLSQNVANELVSSQFGNIYIAEHPSEASLLELIDKNLKSVSSDGNGDTRKPREQIVSDKPNKGTPKPSDKPAKSAEPKPAATAGTSVPPSPNTKSAAAGSSKGTDNKAKTDPLVVGKSKPTSSNLLRNAVLLLIAFLIGVAAWPLILPSVSAYLPEQTKNILQGRASNQQEIASMQMKIDELDAKLSNANDAALVALEGRVNDLFGQVEGVQKSAPVAVNLEPLTNRLETFEGQLAVFAAELENMRGQISANLSTRSETVDQSAATSAQISDISELEITTARLQSEVDRLQQARTSSEAELASQKDLIEALSRAVESGLKSAKEVNANGDQALALLALGQLHRESRTNSSFEGAWQQAIAAVPASLQTSLSDLSEISKTGAPTFTQLNEAFTPLAIEITQAARLPASDTWYGKTLHNIASLVKFRKVGDTDGDTVDAKVANAEDLLGKGELQAAVNALDTLEGEPAAVARDWLLGAKARLKTDQTITALLQNVTAQSMSPSTDQK